MVWFAYFANMITDENPWSFKTADFSFFFLLLEAWKPLQVDYLDWIFNLKVERDPTDSDS